MHDAVLDYVRANLPDGLTNVLEFGSRNLNGSVRGVVGPVDRFVGVDISDGPDVDIVADAATVRVGGEFDLVVCCEVLEHVDDATGAGIVWNAHRHLRPGGRFVATMAGPGRAPHSGREATDLQPGEFYRNVDKALLAGWLTFAGFAEFDIDQAGRDIRCTATR